MENESTPPITVVIKNHTGNAPGIASFIFGFISIFFLAPIFASLAIVMGIIAIINRQLVWAIAGIICAFIGIITSPIIMGILGLSLLFAHHKPVTNQPPQLTLNQTQPTQVHPQIITREQFQSQRIEEANQEATKAITDCKNKRLSGELKNYVESIN